MKKVLKENWSVIVWVITVALDEKYGLAEAIFNKSWQISLFQILGSLILAYQWNPKTNRTKDGGGAIIPNKGL